MANPALTRYAGDNPAGFSWPMDRQTVTIPSTAGNVGYIANVINHDFFDSDWQETNGANSLPNRQSGKQKIPGVELELQPTGAAVLPNGFAEFTMLGKNGVTITWIVAKISNVEKNDGSIDSLNVSARYKLN